MPYIRHVPQRVTKAFTVNLECFETRLSNKAQPRVFTHSLEEPKEPRRSQKDDLKSVERFSFMQRNYRSQTCRCLRARAWCGVEDDVEPVHLLCLRRQCLTTELV